MVKTAVSKTAIPCSNQGGPAKIYTKMKILKNILTELKKSKWPKGKELLVLSIYALVLCGIITAIILGLDLVFYKAREWFLNL